MNPTQKCKCGHAQSSHYGYIYGNMPKRWGAAKDAVVLSLRKLLFKKNRRKLKND